MMDRDSKILITGATGFIGTTLVRQLLKDGYHVRCMSRSEPKLPPGYTEGRETLWGHPNLEHVSGDVTDHDSISRAMDSCRYVFHLAGYAKNYARDVSVYRKTNVEAMRNVFVNAHQQGVEKIVWTSTIVTFGPTRTGEIGDETMPRITEKYYTEYEETKSIAEKEALEWVQRGLPLVIVNPTRVYGPGQLSEGNALGELIYDYYRGRVPVLPNRGINVGNYVLVDDVAHGHFLAMQNGRIGERYILGGENASLRELFAMIDQLSGKKHHLLPMLKPGPIIYSYMLLYWAKLTRSYPRITPGWMKTFLDDWAYSCDKAKNELGYAPVSLEEGLRRTLDWLLEIKKGKKSS